MASVMSIVTKTGDQGTSALMYNRRVSKCHPRLEACGTVDELNAALGLARATAPDRFGQEQLLAAQKEIVGLMGELATAQEDMPRYMREGYALVNLGMVTRLEKAVSDLEAQEAHGRGWATPGATLHTAALDMARAVCRRAERRVCALQEAKEIHRAEPLIYLNRLSDLLWLMARRAENAGATPESGNLRA
ncbi:ATP/cobalamin adenosyltransferase [Verrucomicrobia bacterium]|nr:ATP/cobalamin adenosyltransferase [Verrucomicrobiota bacterium]